MSKNDSSLTSNSEIFTDDEEFVEDSFVQEKKEGGTQSNHSESSIQNSSVEIPDSDSDDEPIVRRRKKKIFAISDSEGEESANNNNEPTGSSASKRSGIDSDDNENSFEVRALSPRTRMSITGFRPHDLTDDESDISDSHETSVHSAFSDEDELHSFDPENPDRLADTNSEKEAINSTSREIPPEKEAEQSDSVSNGDGDNFPRRISTHFNHSIADKFSSTILDPNSPQTLKDKSNQCSSVSDSPVLIQSPQPVINLSSSDSDSTSLKMSTPTSKTFKTVQPKIIDVLDLTRTEEIATGSVNCVSQKFMDEKLRQLSELRSELATCENLVNTLGAKLPDKGKRMSGRGERLRSEIAELAKYITTLKIEEGPSGSQTEVPKVKSLLPNVPTWEELTNAANSIQPKFTGKVGMANFNAQKTLTIERLKDIHVSLESCPGENILAEEPKYLKIALMQHQRHALAWMFWREKQKPRGGILADDMGLGKTLTMISLILASKETATDESQEESDDDDEDDNYTGAWSAKGRKDYYSGGTLIICPASLIRQWEGEVNTRVKNNKLTVCVYHGTNREAKPRTLAKYDMVITTYNLVPREKISNGVLFGVKWDRIILDEAHIIRNHKSKASEAVCTLRARYRWVLTGTPIQNKEMDLYALLKFLKCTPFDELAHWKKWIDNKSAGGQQRLNTLMKSLMLRRTKQQLQEFGTLTLPEKSLQIVEVSLDNEEMNVYQKIMLFSKTLFAQYLFQRAERNNDFVYQSEGNKPTYAQSKDPNGAYYKMHQKFSRLDKNPQVKSTDILVLLLRLRQICCHPGLIDAMLEEEDQAAHMEESYSDQNNQEIDLLDQLNKLQINDDNTNTSQGAENSNNSNDKAISKTLSKALLKTNPVFDFKRPSSKMKKVIEILEQKILNTDDKAIVVSQWTSVLNILKEHLSAKRIPVVCLNGSVPVKLRNDIVNDFNDQRSNKRIMLLSLTAGGVGLNLIGANHLLLFDLHWNPQLESQAQDRIYRVGQKKSVNIYKFMCKETVEERIKTLQDHKLAIANGVLTGVKGSEGSKLSIDDLKSLFGL